MCSDHVFPRHTRSDLPIAVSGDGPYIIDSNGKRYLDGCGGAAVSCLGHSNEAVKTAIKYQLDALPYAHTGFFTTNASETLADMLIERAPEGIERVYFLSGGSEVVETALKLSRQYFLEIDQPRRVNIIARQQSYHGNTLGALAVGGNQWRRAPFEPLLTKAVHHIAPCYAYRNQLESESDEAYGLRTANELEAKILELGADTVAAFVAEPVVGATLGAVASVGTYFKRIREICDQYGVLLILDEIMCGMGRTGTLFACEQDEVRPDMITIAKGLGAGYQPISALLVNGGIYNAIKTGTGFFQHGHTYIGHPTACAGSIEVINQIEKHDLISNVNKMGALLKSELQKKFLKNPNVGDVRGRGLFLGVEFVADCGSKKPFDPAIGFNARVKSNAMQEGLMCYAMGGTVDGQHGDHILLAPPFIIDESHVEQLVDRLDRAISTALQAAKAA